jgi:hypothetical protein
MSQQATNNPLFKHFRQPALYIKLTSGGKYWKEGALELPVTGEIPVYPMTTKDEITLKTPDALVSGTSVVEVIQSCCPNIKNAWEMPSIDVDSTLIAIRMASYGQYMAVSSKCPKCNEEHDYDIDLAKVLAGVQIPDYNQTVDIDSTLSIKLKPMKYKNISLSGKVMFEQERLIQSLSDVGIDDETRSLHYEQHINKMIDLNTTNIANCTESITISGAEDTQIVTNPEFIKEYYNYADSKVSRKIQDRIKELAAEIAIKPVDVACSSCGNEFKISIDFDYTSFFGKGF